MCAVPQVPDDVPDVLSHAIADGTDRVSIGEPFGEPVHAHATSVCQPDAQPKPPQPRALE